MAKKLLTILMSVLIALTTITFNVVAETDENVIENEDIIEEIKEESSDNVLENVVLNEITEEEQNDLYETDLNTEEGKKVKYKISKITDNGGLGNGHTYLIIDTRVASDSANLLYFDTNTNDVATKSVKVETGEDGCYVYGEISEAELIGFDTNYNSLKHINDGVDYYLVSKSGENNSILSFTNSSESIQKYISARRKISDGVYEDEYHIEYSSNAAIYHQTDGNWGSAKNDYKFAYIYEKVIDVTYNANGGSFENGNETVVIETVGQKFKFPKEPTREGYAFVGWYTASEDGKGEQRFDDREQFDGVEQTLYARWAKINEYERVKERDISKLDGKYILINIKDDKESSKKLNIMSVTVDPKHGSYLDALNNEKIYCKYIDNDSIMLQEGSGAVEFTVDKTSGLSFSNGKLEYSDSKINIGTNGTPISIDENYEIKFVDTNNYFVEWVIDNDDNYWKASESKEGSNTYLYKLKEKHEIETIGDVIATVADFPTSYTGAWRNDNGTCYLDTDILWFNKGDFNGLINLSYNVKKSGNNYIYEGSNGKSVTFKMKDGVLESFIVNVNSGNKFDGKYERPHEHEKINFRAWIPSEHDGAVLPNVAGNWYLTEDVTFTKTTEDWDVPEGTTNLCLNGHVINFSKNDKNIKINYEESEEEFTLNLYDCDLLTEHKGYIDTDGLWNLDEKDEHTLKDGEIKKAITGGLITGSKPSEEKFSAICVMCGTFNMYSGTICGNSQKNTFAGGVYIGTDSKFNMYGGSICYNLGYSYSAGGVENYDGSMNIYGGTICYNVGNGVSNSGTMTISGGTICYNGKYGINNDGPLTISGGSICYNNGGGIYNIKEMAMIGGEVSNNIGGGIDLFDAEDFDCILEIDRNAIVKDNKKADDTIENVLIEEGCELNIAETVPTTGMCVGITTQLADGLITETATDYSEYFFSDDSSKVVKFLTDKLVITTAASQAIATPVSDLVYTGAEITNPIEVKSGDNTLDPTKDYTVTFDEGVVVKNAGTYTATVTLNDDSYYFVTKDGSQADKIDVEFEVKKAKVEYSKDGIVDKFLYDGNAHTYDDITVKFGEIELTKGEGKDYIVEYLTDPEKGSEEEPVLITNPTNAGKYTAVVQLLDENGNYCFGYSEESGYDYNDELFFEIQPKEITATIDNENDKYVSIETKTGDDGEYNVYHYVYDGNEYTPVIKFDGVIDDDNPSYVLSYSLIEDETNINGSKDDIDLLDSGEYEMTITLDESGNYCFVNNDYVTIPNMLKRGGAIRFDSEPYYVTIDQAQAYISIPEHVYDEKEYNPFITLDLIVSYKDRNGNDVIFDGTTDAGKQQLKTFITKNILKIDKYYDSTGKEVEKPTEIGKYYTNFVIGNVDKEGKPIGDGNFYLDKKDSDKKYEIKVEFEIIPKTETISVEVEDKEYVYSGSAIEPNVIFYDSDNNELALTINEDYIVEYLNNINASRLMNGDRSTNKPTITVTLKNGDYTFGEDDGKVIAIDFEISPMPLFISLEKETIDYGSDIPSIIFKDKNGNPVSLSLLGDDANLDESNGYQVTYYNKKYENIEDVDSKDIIDKKDIKNVGKYSVVVRVSRNYYFTKKTSMLKSVTGYKHFELLTFEITANVIDYGKLVKDLVKTDLVYNGKYQSPIDSKDLPEGVEYANVSDKKYCNFAVDANNEYKALLKLTDTGSVWSEDAKEHIVTIDGKEYVEVSWKIAKKKATVKVEQKVITYGDKEPTYKLTGEGFVGKEFNTIKKSLKTSREAGTNVGKYKVTAYDASTYPYKGYATRNYDVTYVDSLLIINQKELALPVAKKGLVYNGKAQDGFKDLSYLKGIVKITGETKATNANTYKVTFEITNGNYKWVGTKDNKVTLTYTISAAKVDVTINPLSFVYNGKEQTPKVTLKSNGKTISDGYKVIAYSFDKKGLSNDITNAGDKYVTVVLLTDNYTFGGLKSDYEVPNELNAKGETYTKQYKIVPATLVASISNKDKSFVYDGEEHKPVPTVKITSGSLSGTLLDSANYDIAYSKDVTNAGDKNITITLYDLAARNYNFVVGKDNVDSVKLDYSITPRSVKVKWSKKSSFTYNGKEQKPVLSITSGIVKKDFKKIGVASYVTKVNDDSKIKSIDAGKYVAYAVLTGDVYGNYVIENSFFNPTSKYFEITPKTIYTHWENLEFVYDGKVHSPKLVIKGTELRDHISYIQIDLPSGEIPSEEELNAKIDEAQRSNEALYQFRDAGTYYTFALITGNTDNYKFVGKNKDDIDPFTGLISFTEFNIYPRKLKVLWSDKAKFSAKDYAQAPEILGLEVLNDPDNDDAIVDWDKKYNGEEIVYVDYDEENGPKTKVGKYVAKAKLYTSDNEFMAYLHPTSNYVLVDDEVNFEIYKKSDGGYTPVKTGVN